MMKFCSSTLPFTETMPRSREIVSPGSLTKRLIKKEQKQKVKEQMKEQDY
jgi:hypothetical protein